MKQLKFIQITGFVVDIRQFYVAFISGWITASQIRFLLKLSMILIDPSLCFIIMCSYFLDYFLSSDTRDQSVESIEDQLAEYLIRVESMMFLIDRYCDAYQFIESIRRQEGFTYLMLKFGVSLGASTAITMIFYGYIQLNLIFILVIWAFLIRSSITTMKARMQLK